MKKIEVLTNAKIRTIEKYNVGVTLVYSTNKNDGTTTYNGLHFSGEEYNLTTISDDELFKAWKAVFATHWDVTVQEHVLKIDNNAIASKLKTKTPNKVIFTAQDGKISEIECKLSVWRSIGLVPNKKDIDELKTQYKQKLHRACVASYNALGLRIEKEKETKKASK